MPNMLMSMGRAPIPPSEAEIRSTVTAVDDDAPSAAETAPPDWNQLTTDPDTEGGLTDHQESAYRIPSVQSVPVLIETASNEGPQLVNARISSEGTAAAREAAGVRGHGTLNFSQSIEPTFPDGHQFGSDYFKVERNGVVSDMMTPAALPDVATASAAQATATANSRDAVSQSQTGSPYQAMLDTFMGRR